MQWRKFTDASQTRARSMLCCGRRKENGGGVPDVTSSPGRLQTVANHTSAASAPMLLQSDFRKVSGISSDIFRQIEVVENEHDATTAAALEAVERRGEMIVRILELRQIGRNNIEAAKKFFALQDPKHIVQLVEIVKRPGQTLGLYIREGDGGARADGVFISRIALESAVYSSGCLKVGDEILAVNLVDVRRMSLDDVVIIMSIPRRLLLVTRQRKGKSGPGSPSLPLRSDHKPPPVVVIKRGDLRDDEIERHHNSYTQESGSSLRQRHTGDGREERHMSGARASPDSWRLPPSAAPRTALTSQPSRSGSDHHLQRHDDTHSLLRSSLKASATGSLSRYNQQRYGGGLTNSSLVNSGLGNFVDSPGLSTGSPSLSALGSYANGPTYGTSGYSSVGGGAGVYGNGPGGYSTLPYAGAGSTAPNMGSSSALAGLAGYGATGSSVLNNYSTLGSAYSSSKIASAGRRSRTLDYSSDTEASCPTRTPYYLGGYRGTSTGATSSLSRDISTKFNSLPRDVRNSTTRMSFGRRLGSLMQDEQEDAERFGRSRLSMSPSVFTSDEYRAWLSRAPSTSAIYDLLRPRNNTHYSAENIHDALKNLETSSRFGSTLNISSTRGLPPRSLSTQHIARSGSLAGLGLGSSTLGFSSTLGRRRLDLENTLCPSPVPTPSARTGRHIDINPSEFLRYKTEKPIPSASASMSGISRFAAGGTASGGSGVSGLLWVHLLSGRGLLAADHVPPRDLYTVLECDRVHKARTVVRTGDAQFDWDESFELDLVENKQLDLLVYSWDPQQRHRLCVRGAVRLTEVCVRGGARLALRLEPRGTLYLRLKHTPPNELYRRRLAPPASTRPLFGADLDAVVSRDAREGRGNSSGVPAIIRRCVEEIERRGLDIIGLYRLCGSATKKRILREAFERNPRGVELSPDSVPDINVITGLLKDYLRELPQPLITPALTQLLLDALGSLGVDRSGGASLISRCIEALPRAARATLLYLLDHFALVVAAADRNKMGPSALSAALAGPLMLSAPRDLDHRQPIALLKCILQMWPPPKRSVRRAEPEHAQRGDKANASLLEQQTISTGRALASVNQYRQAAVASVQSQQRAPSDIQSPDQSPTDQHAHSSVKGGPFHHQLPSQITMQHNTVSHNTSNTLKSDHSPNNDLSNSILRQNTRTQQPDIITPKEVTWRVPEVASLPRINESNRELQHEDINDDEKPHSGEKVNATSKYKNFNAKPAASSAPAKTNAKMTLEEQDDEIEREIYKRDLEISSFQKRAYDLNKDYQNLFDNKDSEKSDISGRHTLGRIHETNREVQSNGYDNDLDTRTRSDDSEPKKCETLPRKYQNKRENYERNVYDYNSRTDTLPLIKESTRESPSKSFDSSRAPSPRNIIPGTSAGLAVTLNDEPLAGFQMAPVSSQLVSQAVPGYALPAYSSTNPFLQNYDPDEEVETTEVPWRADDIFSRTDP